MSLEEVYVDLIRLEFLHQTYLDCYKTSAKAH